MRWRFGLNQFFFSESWSLKLDYESSKVSHPLMNEKMMKIHEETLQKRKTPIYEREI